jgi:hypothetical protein
MPSTFGSFIVYQDACGFHIAQNPPKHLGESPAERTHYAGSPGARGRGGSAARY